MCDECQELNALYSLCVDGGSVRIPDRLEKIPERKDGEPFVLDVLHKAAEEFAVQFHCSQRSWLRIAAVAPGKSESLSG